MLSITAEEGGFTAEEGGFTAEEGGFTAEKGGLQCVITVCDYRNQSVAGSLFLLS
jgi:hypothetical protein